MLCSGIYQLHQLGILLKYNVNIYSKDKIYDYSETSVYIMEETDASKKLNNNLINLILKRAEIRTNIRSNPTGFFFVTARLPMVGIICF